MVGQLVGKYRVVSRLGRGGMGTVYKAVDETLNREVAIKCLNPDVGDAEVLKRFRAEAIALARLNHPNIATLFELTEHNGELLMVMEFVRGETFDQVSAHAGPMPVERATQLAGQVFDALAHAHRAGVVHRDLKPANLMLTESGVVKIMDFGLARMAGTEHLTSDGYMVGTPAYMSPEQVLGWEIDGRSDLYAMGVVLFRLLSGQLPFKAESGIAMAHKQINDPPTPVRQLRTELSWEIEEVLKKALAKPPGDRYQTADEFKAALMAVVGAPSGPNPDATPTLSITRAVSVRASALAMSPPPTFITPASPVAAAGAAPDAAKAAAPVSSGSSRPRMPLAAVVALGVVLVAAVPALIVWRARAAQSETASAAPGPVTSAPAAVETPAPAALETPAPATPAAPPPAVPVAKSADTVKPPDGLKPLAPSTGGPGRGGAIPNPDKPPAAASAKDVAAATDPTAAKDPEAASAPAPAVLPNVTFGRMKLLILADGKSRDLDASLRLGPDVLHVLEGEKTLQQAAYRDIVSVFHSHSREPRWTGPDGKSVVVGKVGGKFSFLKGAPDWITVRTKQMFIPLRVQDGDLSRIIKELESRTGTKVVQTR